MSTTAGDFVDGVLAHRATSLATILVLVILLAVLEQGAPNRFITVSILVVAALLGWLVGAAYGKRKTVRSFAHRSKGSKR